MKTKTLLLALIALNTCFVFGQSSSKITRNFASPIMSDSSSVIMIPIIYEASLFTSDKLALWGDFYSNIIFYNFKTDSSKRLFPEDTYIVSFNRVNYYSYADRKPAPSIASGRIFYQVMNFDRNENDKMDRDDPRILYTSDIYGNHLQALTSQNENVVGFELYEKQGFAMVKMQRDKNDDGDFTYKDTDYYYMKLDLKTLAFGHKIELK